MSANHEADEVSRATGFTAAFTKPACALAKAATTKGAMLATILANASNLGLMRMAAAVGAYPIDSATDANHRHRRGDQHGPRLPGGGAARDWLR
jgi:Tn3 transposase DDE domain